MGPLECAENLKAIANYIERTPDPHISFVKNNLHGVLNAMSGKREAASVKKVVGNEIEMAISGLRSLVEKVTKVSKTLNKQDEAYVQVMRIKKNLESTLESLILQTEDLKKLSV